MLFFLRNVQDLLADGKKHLMNRDLKNLGGKYHPISAKDQSRLHQYGKKVLPGIILGYA